MIQEQGNHQRYSHRWLILASCFTITFMIMGSRSTWGIFVSSITKDLGGERGSISLLFSINLLLSTILLPFTGYVMDRIGAKWLFTASVAVYGLGLGLTGFAHSVPYLLVIYGIVVGIATAGASTALTNALVAQYFQRGRATAISVSNAGLFFWQMLLTPLIAWLFSISGWRQISMYLGAAVLGWQYRWRY